MSKSLSPEQRQRFMEEYISWKNGEIDPKVLEEVNLSEEQLEKIDEALVKLAKCSREITAAQEEVLSILGSVDVDLQKKCIAAFDASESFLTEKAAPYFYRIGYEDGKKGK